MYLCINYIKLFYWGDRIIVVFGLKIESLQEFVFTFAYLGYKSLCPKKFGFMIFNTNLSLLDPSPILCSSTALVIYALNCPLKQNCLDIFF